MTTTGTTYPSALDPPLDATLTDDFDPDHANTADARARAVQDKVGIDGDTRVASIDYRIRHIPSGINLSGRNDDASAAALWTLLMVEGTVVTLSLTFAAVREGANEALGYGIVATYRCKSGLATLVGAQLVTHDQRTLLSSAAVTLTDNGANGVKLNFESGVADRVHWTVRGTVVTAQPGGM